ncbi:pilus assembly protein [Oligoflexia bacterium]|nr:pilus assembly protein [Oligoflexia bacterium]
MRYLPKKKTFSQAGASLVEFALVLPVLVLMFAYFWDTLVDINLHIRHASAAVQLAVNFSTTPIRATVVTDAQSGDTDIQISILSTEDDLTGGTGFLTSFNDLFNDVMAASGTFANKIEHNIAVRMVYFCIHDENLAPPPGCTGFVVPGGIQPGQVYGSFVAGPSDGSGGFTPINFHTSPGSASGGSSACFQKGGGIVALTAQFQNYATSQINKLLAATIPFGTLMVNVPTGLPNMGQLVRYLRYKPVVFWMMCSRAPRFFSSEAVIDLGIYYPDNEIGYAPVAAGP